MRDTPYRVMAAAPFAGDVEFFSQYEVELGGVKFPSKLCYGDFLERALHLNIRVVIIIVRFYTGAR